VPDRLFSHKIIFDLENTNSATLAHPFATVKMADDDDFPTGEGLTEEVTSRPASVDLAGHSDTSDMVQQMGSLLGSNLTAGMGGLPGYILLIFPKLLARLSHYPRLSKLLTFALTLALASYLNAGMVSTFFSTCWAWFISLFTSSVSLSGQDPIIDGVQIWLRKMPMLLPSNSLRGESNYLIKKREANNGDWDYYSDDEDSQYDEDAPPKQTEEQPFRIVLHRSNHLQLFRHRGRYFLVKKDGIPDLYDPSTVSAMTFFCFGWSPKPITELLAHVDRSQKLVQEQSWTTTIRTHEQNGYGNWSRPQTKMARPITSVDLDEGQREMIVGDLADYLDPACKVSVFRSSLDRTVLICIRPGITSSESHTDVGICFMVHLERVSRRLPWLWRVISSSTFTLFRCATRT
jgi:hypothetical protein